MSSPVHRTATVVIGAGQAGLALSRCLAGAGHDHVVLERGRIGERWRSERWPSLRLLTPNWLNVLPGAPAPADPDGFQPAREFADGLAAYACSFGAPVLERHAVRLVARTGDDYRVQSPHATWLARQVVVATGDCDRPRMPAAARDTPRWLHARHATSYTTPDDLPAGPVLVVGAGATGQQLALELARAGRRVVLAVGRHARMPRRYRGRDAFAWLDALGILDQRIEDVAEPRRARRPRGFALLAGGELDLNVLRAAGVELAGRLAGFDGGVARFAGDLEASVADADARLGRLLDRIDAHAGGPPPCPRFQPGPRGSGPASVDLRGFGAVLWATGYRRAYPWLRVPVLDRHGELIHDRGTTPAHGLHVLGLPFQRHRSSHFIGGVGRDAAELAALLTRHRARRAA
jgi:putative flavoprotein involved in K+ transport